MMDELTNKVKDLTIPVTPKAQPAAEIIEQARALEGTGEAQQALAFVLAAEARGNVVPYRQLVGCDVQSWCLNVPAPLRVCSSRSGPRRSSSS